MFSGIEADIVLYGHDHSMAVNQDGHRLYVIADRSAVRQEMAAWQERAF
jgi:hypothetical protein